MSKIKLEHLMKAFWSGVAYGQLLMEEERMMEEGFDAFQGSIISNKYCMPSYPAPRRQLHSDKWFAEMKKGKNEFDEMYKSFITEKQQNVLKENYLFEE